MVSQSILKLKYDAFSKTAEDEDHCGKCKLFVYRCVVFSCFIKHDVTLTRVFAMLCLCVYMCLCAV